MGDGDTGGQARWGTRERRVPWGTQEEGSQHPVSGLGDWTLEWAWEWGGGGEAGEMMRWGVKALPSPIKGLSGGHVVTHKGPSSSAGVGRQREVRFVVIFPRVWDWMGPHKIYILPRTPECGLIWKQGL